MWMTRRLSCGEKFDALSLPDGCSDPAIYNFNVNDMMPVAMIALSGEDLSQLQNLAEETVGPALERSGRGCFRRYHGRH